MRYVCIAYGNVMIMNRCMRTAKNNKPQPP